MSCEIESWSAHIYDDGGERVLHVIGEGSCTATGHSLRLSRTNEGIVDDPDVFVVALEVDEPDLANPVITPAKVEETFPIGDDPATRVEVRGDASASVSIEG